MNRIPIFLFCAFGFFGAGLAFAQPAPGTNYNRLLTSWTFTDTNWLSSAGFPPRSFSNIYNEPDGNDDCLWLDTTNSDPAFLFYNAVETNGFTNLTLSTGSISLWLNPDWSSTNQGGTGPGNWANLISLGQAGTNGSSWWAWYFSPDGCNLYFSSQTNSGPFSNYLAAPVSLNAGNWYNLVLTYSPTNTAFYTNGMLVTNGIGVAYWPGPDVAFFAVGSDTNGLFQAEGEFDDLQTYNYPMDSNMVSDLFGLYSIFYGLAGGGGAPQASIASAPSTNTVLPTFDAVTGPGFLMPLNTNVPPSSVSSNVWLTNWSTTMVSSNVMNVNFALGGGLNGVPYDVFATSVLQYPITNSTWYWMGQAYRGTNYGIPITNLYNSAVYFILGKTNDFDQDGLTDAYELLVSHTSPTNATSANDGILDGWKVVWGLPMSGDSAANPNLRLNYGYDAAGRLQTVSGVRAESLGFDYEGNILSN